jgi:rod shape determining protein RodA
MLPLLGKTVNNARRWYDLGPVSVQPSEGMKFIAVIVLAQYFRRARRTKRLLDLVPALALIGLPMLFIATQPDVGTALMFLPVFFAMAFISGVPKRNLTLLLVAGCAVALVGWFTPGVLKDYQKERVLAFVAPEQVAGTNAAAHSEQAVRAIRAGGMHGEGWGRGVLNQRGLLSERHTDFIFVVIAEEWGFYRTAGVVLLYLTLIAVLALLTMLTRDRFGRLLAAGVTAMLAFQGLVNMAIAVRLAPITGLTLPFISYGGSSLVSAYAALGLVASVFMRPSKTYPEEEE